MHWNTTDEGYHQALRRLAVILLMLAAVAERTACRSWPIRSLVLWLLRRAETRAHGFAERAGAVPLMRGECRVCPPGGPDEAARLARSFRALAAVFRALARQALQWLRITRRHRLPGGRTDSLRLGRLPLASRLPYADTS